MIASIINAVKYMLFVVGVSVIMGWIGFHMADDDGDVTCVLVVYSIIIGILLTTMIVMAGLL